MAVRTVTKFPIVSPVGSNPGIVGIATGLLNGDTSAAFGPANRFLRRATVTWSVFGLPSVGGSINLEGSDDASSWTVLDTVIAVQNGRTVNVNFAFLRFNVTAGDGSTLLGAFAEFGPGIQG